MTIEKANAQDTASATVIRGASGVEQCNAQGVYQATCTGPKEEHRAEYLALMAEAAALVSKDQVAEANILIDKASTFLEEKWAIPVCNVVTTEGKNDALDKYLSGAAYTAAFYLGLITSTSYTAVAAGDTAAQINGSNGWKEAGAVNDPHYSNGTRVAATFGAAAAGVKATSAASVFNMTTTGTVKGFFLSTSSVKDGTAGVLYSAGLFVEGDKLVDNGDILNVTYAASL